MLGSGSPVLVEYFTGTGTLGKKEGIYEADSLTLARRIELPHDAEDLVEEAKQSNQLLLDLLKSGKNIPASRTGESQGQMYWYPDSQYQSTVPLIGVDVSVWDKYPPNKPPRLITIDFYVYRPDYQLTEVWSILTRIFREKCQRVQPDDRFMPQYMVPVDLLMNNPDPISVKAEQQRRDSA